MCLPVNCIKYVLSFFAWITIVIGLAGIITGTVFLIQQGGHIDFNEFNPVAISTSLLLGTGVAALLVGIIGLIGSQKKSKCCLCIYQFSVFPMVILSLALACLATYATYMVNEMNSDIGSLTACNWQKPTEDCAKCGNNGLLEWIQEYNTEIYQVTTGVLGQGDCIILAGSADDQIIYEGWNYTAVLEQNPGVVSNALNCPNLTSNQKNAGKFISYFEQEFNCSGLCAATPFFAFYDTSKPINLQNESCYSKIANSLNSTTVTAISWSIFAYFLLNMILACCLCCHPSRKDQKLNSGEAVYSRMNYYD